MKTGKVKRYFIQCLAVTGLVMGMMTGCGSSQTAMRESADLSAQKTEEMTEAADQSNEQSMTSENGAYSEIPKIDTSSAYRRKIVRTGTMVLQTKAFTETIQDIFSNVKSLNGYVEKIDLGGSSYYDEYREQKTATLTVRIPQSSFDTFINSGGKFGNVTDLTCSTEDVTSEYVDTQAHIEVLKTRYDRLLALMKKVDKYEDIFKFEKEIADVEYEINTYQGKLNHFDSVVDMSTLDITVKEVSKEEDTPQELSFTAQLRQGMADSFRQVKNIMKAVVIGIVTLVPYLIILIPIILAGFYLYKRIWGRQKKEKNKEQEEKQD